MFEQFLHHSVHDTVKQYGNYMGISKTEYPRWLGWKIIDSYKTLGVHVSEIHDNDLQLLVYNFYYLKWIQREY